MMTSPQNSETTTPPAPSSALPPWCERHQCELEPLGRPVVGGAEVAISQKALEWACPRCGEEEIEESRRKDLEQFLNERAAGARQRKQDELEKRLGRACIPKRYLGMTFDTFPGRTQESMKHCSTLRSYANQFLAMSEQGISVLLVGGAGTGKTGLACSVANVVIRDHHRTALFISAYGAVRHMRDTWGRRGRTETDALADLLAPDLLILDEVGSSVGTDAETASLFEVLNGRYQERKATMVLSNLPMDDYDVGGTRHPGLRSYLGTRVIDRFCDDGSFTLAFDWPSLRGAKA